MKIGMYIDGLLKPYMAFVKLKEKFFQRRDKALATINQTVFFRDLVIDFNPYFSYGESHDHTNLYFQPTADRLKAQISSLFTLTNEEHRANYCELQADGTFVLKEDKKNHITRLSMNEFSLYASKPFTSSEFGTLFSEIKTMAEQLEPNVHVLLSSFAVLDNHGKVQNIVLYVEGGKPPKIHSLAKNTASVVDVDFGKPATLFSQQGPSFTSRHADSITSSTGTNIYTGSVFEVQTEGGAIYTQTVDICLDHALGHSKEQIERWVSGEVAPDELIPKQIEQCITSNSISITPRGVIATKVLHADTVDRMHEKHHAELGARVLNREAINRIIPSGFPAMSITEAPKGYFVNNPPFGSSFEIEILAERPAAHYLNYYRGPIDKHNQTAIERQWNAAIAHEQSAVMKHVKSLALSDKVEESISNRVEQLATGIEKLCRTTWLERLFKTEEYKEKMEARQILEESLASIRNALSTQKNATLFLIKPWRKDLEFRLDRIGTIETDNVFKQQLKGVIKDAINGLQNDVSHSFEIVDEDEEGESEGPSPK